MPHTEPRDYFVTIRRGQRHGFLLGPYATHTEALEQVDRGRRLAVEIDPKTWWDAFGTGSLPAGSGVVGKLNNMLEEAK